MKHLALIMTTCIAAMSASAQFVDITVVHNVPDPAVATVDVYITQGGITNKIEDLAYRSAKNVSDVVSLFPGLEVIVRLAPASSTSESEALLTETITPEEGDIYVVTAVGVVDPSSGWVANPNGVAIAASLKKLKVLSEPADPSKTGVYFVHGATDFDAGDVYIRGRAQAIATNFKFGDQTATMTEITRDRIIVDITQPGQKTKVLASFEVDLTPLSSVVLFELSGFKTPGDNKGSTDTLSLVAVLANGSTIRYPLLAGSQTARVQFVHNVSATAAGVIDVYLNGERRLDNFQFRRATPFSDVVAGAPLVFGLAPATSKDSRDITDTIELPALRPGRVYTMILSGVPDTATFAKNPDGRNISLGIQVLEGALEASSVDGKTSLRVAHGATDAPGVIIERGSTPLGGALSYGDATAEYAAVEPVMDTLWVRNAATNAYIKGYVADLRGTRKAFVAVASGFLNPAANGNGAAFRLILVDASGNVATNMAEITKDTTTSVDEPLVPASAWTVAPIPATEQVVMSVDVPADLALFVVHDITGTVVATVTAVGAGRPEAVIGTSHLAPGTYHVRALLPDGRLIGTSRFVRR
jgi:hypothetical protein